MIGLYFHQYFIKEREGWGPIVCYLKAKSVIWKNVDIATLLAIIKKYVPSLLLLRAVLEGSGVLSVLVGAWSLDSDSIFFVLFLLVISSDAMFTWY